MRVVITGANRGLGLELVKVFARRGDTVLAGCRNPDSAADLQALTPHVAAVDMESEDGVAAFGAWAAAGGPVDVLVNNAGLDAGAFGVASDARDVLALSTEHIRREFGVNAVAPLVLARSLIGALGAAEHGRIVNIGSQIGSMVVSARMGRDVGYAVSKAALNMITVKLAVRLRAEGITSVVLHPGYLRTAMGGAAADLEPADAAGQIVALIDGLTLEQSGSFLRWDGTEHPW